MFKSSNVQPLFQSGNCVCLSLQLVFRVVCNDVCCVCVYSRQISHCMMAVYVDDRYLNVQDSDFVNLISSDLRRFLDSIEEKTNQ